LAYLAPFPRKTVISIENHQFFPPSVYLLSPLKGLPLELGISEGVKETRMMGLPDDRKSFKIGLTI